MRASPGGAALILLLAVPIACARGERSDAVPRGSVASDSPTGSGTPSGPAPGAASCAEGQRALEQHLVAGGNACATDEDCTCVDLPQAAPQGRKEPFCGVVVPTDRAAPLREENQRLATAGCSPTGTCAPAACEAMCIPRAMAGYCDKRTRCREITVQADALVKKLDRTCKRDSDCAGYPAGIAQDCGGVARKSSVAPLLALAKEFHERSCKYAVNCAPRAAGRPACGDGLCYEAPMR